jgi:hypothetical protein
VRLHSIPLVPETALPLVPETALLRLAEAPRFCNRRKPHSVNAHVQVQAQVGSRTSWNSEAALLLVSETAFPLVPYYIWLPLRLTPVARSAAPPAVPRTRCPLVYACSALHSRPPPRIYPHARLPFVHSCTPPTAVFTLMGPLDADLLSLIAPRSSHRTHTGVGAMDSGHCPPPRRGAGPLFLRYLLPWAARVCR